MLVNGSVFRHSLGAVALAGAALLALDCTGAGVRDDSGDGDTGSGGSTGASRGGTKGGGGGARASGGASASSTGGSSGAGSGGAPISSGDTGGTRSTSAAPFSVAAGYGKADAYQGFWYTYKDAGGSTITPECGGKASPCFSAASQICVMGSAAQVMMMMYSTYWGAGVGWNLNQAAGGLAPAMGASLAGKTAVTIDLQMNTAAPLRLKFKVVGDLSDYCTNLAAGSNTVPFTMITKECWSPGGVPLPTDAPIEAMQLQIPSTDGAATPFDFCIKDIAFK